MAADSGSSDFQRQIAAQRRAKELEARQEARAAEQARKDALKRYEQDRIAEAVELTKAAEQQLVDLDNILAKSLADPPRGVDFNALKRRPAEISLDLGTEAQPMAAPVWQDFEPARPSSLGRLLGGEARYARERAQAELDFAAAVDAYRTYEVNRQRRVAEARRVHAGRQAAARAEADTHNAKIDRFAAAVRGGDRHAVSRYAQMAIDRVPDPPRFRRQRLAGYVPESTLLALEWQLPAIDVVPAQRAFKWVKTRDELVGTSRPAVDIRQAYQKLVAQLALRAVHTVFSIDRFSLVNTVVFNGYVEAIDPVTGQSITPCLIMLRANREQFSGLKLANVDPVACVRKYFGADVSPHPEELQAVTPVMEFKMADPRIIDPVDVISRIDKRPNLLELTAKEFEYFVHNLFTRMGFDTKVVAASGDGGVDCVAYDPTPIRGGKYVIQAKLYNKTVPPAAVRDLYGTMQHEGAKSGILITTSGYGPSSYEFANGKPLQLIDGSGLLAICKEYGIPARIVPPSK
ncbi:restriction endonuclease [Dactylosporangium vinaceum]|uniref:Restriction endonuclease n=1 Tax=Dactylosporangium vinaceum TaxID=53362 RepID=A0ABV5MLH1_9ACTN|nr:restriction endonuclease [Dactylosporangium vinaceum]UAB96984.1 restriction endonuclease [Dactylosporangium vinaceum]